MTDNEIFMTVLNKNVEDYGLSYEYPEEGNNNLISIYYSEQLLGTLNLEGKTLAYNLSVLNDLMSVVFTDIDKKNGVNVESSDEKANSEPNVIDASFSDSSESSESTGDVDNGDVDDESTKEESTSAKDDSVGESEK